MTFQKAAPAQDETSAESTKLALSRHQVEVMSNSLDNSSLKELMKLTGRADRTKFRHHVLRPLIDDGLIEMTLPDKPRSSKQKYRLTERGRTVLATVSKKVEE